MINSFLVTLANTATPPVSGTSTTGNVLWPATYLVRTFTPSEAFARACLFQAPVNAFDEFLIAIQLLWVVENSVCADKILTDDTRVSYNHAQLVGQFSGITTHDNQHTTKVLSSLETLQPLTFILDTLKPIYRGSLSATDKLACVITHFGLRP